MKILYITDILTKMGGAERNLLQLALGLKERGYEPIVFCLKGGQLKHTLSEHRIEVADLQLKRIYDFRALKTILRLVRFIRERKIDIIVTYHVDSDFLGLILSKICRTPIISSRRDMGFSLKRRHVRTYRFVNSLFDGITAVSDAVKKVIWEKQKVGLQKIKVIYNGLDSSKFSTDAAMPKAKEELGIHGGPIVGCLANLRTIKGQRYLVEAAEKVLQKIPDVQFLLVGLYDANGTDEYHKEICKLLKASGIEKKFIFAGERYDIPQILSLMDISVVPSLSEGFSNTILESMATGKPVVATNVGGNPEAVIHRETGLLVPPTDSLALARAITYLLTDRTLAKHMGEAGRKRVETEFSLERLIRANEEFYEFVIEKHRAKNKIWILGKWLRAKVILITVMKTLLSGILYYSGTIKTYLWIRRLLGKPIVKILAYHNISDRYPPYLGISQRVMEFEDQVKFLIDNYHIIPLQEAVELLKKKKRSRNAIALTFDDCYKEFYSNIFPILQKHEIPATFFLTVDPIQSGIPLSVDLLILSMAKTEKTLLDMTPFGLKKYLLETPSQKEEAIFEINEHVKELEAREGQELIEEIYNRLGLNLEDARQLNAVLSWEDVKEMKNNRITFGSHTLTHPNLVAIPVKEAGKEISKSKEVLEEKIGSKVSFFAYPYGGEKNINDTIIKLVKSTGFLGAVTLARNAANKFSPFLLPRLLLSQSLTSGFRGNFSKSLFAVEVSGLSDYLFFRFFRGRDRGVKKSS